MNFTYLEKKAMVRMLMTLSAQDGQIDENELQVIKDSLKVDNDLIRNAVTVDLDDAMNTVKSMHIKGKMDFAVIVVNVAQADGFLHPKEVELIAQYFEITGISQFLEARNKYNDAVKDFRNKNR